MQSPPTVTRLEVSEVRAAAEHIARSVLVTAPAPRPVELRSLADIDAGPAPRSWVDASARTLEAMIIARARLDDIPGGLRLVDEHFVDGRLRVPATIAPATRSSLFAAVAEMYAAAGWPRRAGVYASAAIAYADDAATLYRAHAARSLAAALNGEYPLAVESSDICRDLAFTSGWDEVFEDYLLLLARTLIASAALDADALAEISRHLRTQGADDAAWLYTARTADAMALLIRREYGEGIATLVTLTSGMDAHRSHAMVRGFALGVLADTLLARGEPRRALAALEGKESLPGHALCFDMQRAAALISLGREREVLESTDGCIRLGTEHCVRTLIPLLLRRAVAHARLGNLEAADMTFAEGFHLGENLGGSLTPYLTLPHTDLEMLLDRLGHREPATAEAAERVAGRLELVPARSERPPLPTLTPREERVALLLRGARTLPQIAEKLGVSPNTVKSQLRSIYAKLAVSGRESAVMVLESNGFYV